MNCLLVVQVFLLLIYACLDFTWLSCELFLRGCVLILEFGKQSLIVLQLNTLPEPQMRLIIRNYTIIVMVYFRMLATFIIFDVFYQIDATHALVREFLLIRGLSRWSLLCLLNLFDMLSQS